MVRFCNRRGSAHDVLRWVHRPYAVDPAGWTHSRCADCRGHRTGIFYSWWLAAVAVISLAVGIWLTRWEPPPSDIIVSFYTLGTLIAALGVTALMILRAHQTAKQKAIEQVLAEEGEEIDALLAQEYKRGH